MPVAPLACDAAHQLWRLRRVRQGAANRMHSSQPVFKGAKLKAQLAKEGACKAVKLHSSRRRCCLMALLHQV